MKNDSFGEVKETKFIHAAIPLTFLVCILNIHYKVYTSLPTHPYYYFRNVSCFYSYVPFKIQMGLFN